MSKIITWNSEKNSWLVSQKDRAIRFEDIVAAIEMGFLLDDIEHINSEKYPNQRIYVVLIDDYVYCVPYVENENEIFLKTIYPSRKFTSLYLTGNDDE